MNNNLGVPETVISRQKFILEPGYSPLDWARLKKTKNLREGWTGPQRYTLEDLSKHKAKNDAWTAIMGKVYNITPYLKFHPGGYEMLFSVAGRDGTKKFQKYHQWVNADMLLDSCFLGYLVPN
eukprot:NODE_2_length_91304_cov_0.692462.p74 type:complete len:123 gc:universal NODE_2_length_91304_cov_0.692462:28020-27652(-)